MELTDPEMRLLARLSRGRRLHAECKGADLEALQKLGLVQWFDARSSTTPFKEDPRPLFRLLLFGGRIDYFWVAPVANWRELVGPEVAAKADAIEKIDWAVTSGPLTGAGLVEQTRSRPKGIATLREAGWDGSSTSSALSGDEDARRLGQGNWRPIGETKWLIAER